MIERLHGLLLAFAAKIDFWADTPIIAFTHLQPAEPSTLGYRLASYAQDLYLDWQAADGPAPEPARQGLRGAVGSGAAFAELIGVERLERFRGPHGRS